MIRQYFFKIINKYNINYSLNCLLLTAALIALIAAYISQYIFGLQPCPLCIYQRIPFFFIVFFLAPSLLFLSKNYKIQKIMLLIALFLLFSNGILALYHVGVEQKIFIFDKCGDIIGNVNNLEDLKRQISQTKAVRCDEPQFFLLNISMAGWNVIYCFGMVILAVFLLKVSAKTLVQTNLNKS